MGLPQNQLARQRPTLFGDESFPIFVESRRGATAVGRKESLLPAAFAIMPVPQSPPWPRFLSPLPEPAVRFSRNGLSSGTMPLAHGSIRHRWEWRNDFRRPHLESGTSPSSPRPLPIPAASRSSPRRRRPQSPASARSHGRSPSLSHAVVPALPNSNRGSRPSHSRSPSHFPSPVLTRGPFPPPALPGFSGTTGLSATPTAQAGPHGFPVDACHATGGASRVATSSLLSTCHRQYPGGTDRCFRRSLPGRWQPSCVSQAGRLPHCPFRGLLSVRSRCSLRTR